MQQFNRNGIVLIALCVYFIAFNAHANDIENTFIKAGLIDVHDIDPTIQVELVNSDPDKNFFRENFYHGLKKAYLRRSVAEKLSLAQAYLRSEYPDCSIRIMDAARPRVVSQRMYEKMKGTRFEKFVANPDKGSMHNHGVAVDVTLVDGKGNELDMGFTPSAAQKENRNLLATVMTKAGFLPLSYEWWHFNGMPKAEARKMYPIIE